MFYTLSESRLEEITTAECLCVLGVRARISTTTTKATLDELDQTRNMNYNETKERKETQGFRGFLLAHSTLIYKQKWHIPLKVELP